MRYALSLIAVLAACGDDGGSTAIDAPLGAGDTPPPPDAMPRQVVMEQVPLVATEIVEAVLVGGSGDIAGIRLVAPVAELDWNIHGHANGGTQVVAEALNQMTVEYVFKPAAQADWYLLLRNSGPTNMAVELKIELYGDITWSGWQ